MKRMITIIPVLVLAITLFSSCSRGTEGNDDGQMANDGQMVNDEQKTFRFVMISKVVHPWFDQVEKGALAAAENLAAETGDIFKVEYRAPENADVVQQNEIIERTIATNPDGIFLTCLILMETVYCLRKRFHEAFLW